MSGYWLRCDACNKALKVQADQEMMLVVRFRPSRLSADLGVIHVDGHRCRSCGWVNVFAPVDDPAAASPALTRPRWRDMVTK